MFGPVPSSTKEMLYAGFIFDIWLCSAPLWVKMKGWIRLTGNFFQLPRSKPDEKKRQVLETSIYETFLQNRFLRALH